MISASEGPWNYIEKTSLGPLCVACMKWPVCAK